MHAAACSWRLRAPPLRFNPCPSPPAPRPGTHDVLRIRLLEPPASAGTADAGDGGGGADVRTPPRFVLLPFAKQLVPVVDLAAGRMEINPPEGLLELATAPAAKADRRESRGRRERRRQGRRAGSDAAASEPEASEAGDE